MFYQGVFVNVHDITRRILRYCGREWCRSKSTTSSKARGPNRPDAALLSRDRASERLFRRCRCQGGDPVTMAITTSENACWHLWSTLGLPNVPINAGDFGPSKVRGENKKYLKPPPSGVTTVATARDPIFLGPASSIGDLKWFFWSRWRLLVVQTHVAGTDLFRTCVKGYIWW